MVSMAIDKRATRLGVLALVGTLLFSLIGARLWFLQTVEQESLQQEVDTTKLRTLPLLPERGRSQGHCRRGVGMRIAINLSSLS